MLKDSVRVDFHTGQPEEVPNSQDQRRVVGPCMHETSMGPDRWILMLGDLVILGKGINEWSEIQVCGSLNEQNIAGIDSERSIPHITKTTH